MKRDIPTLLGSQFDVVVVGAGVYGACIAAQLSASGYRVALIEAADFGGGTSANSLGILHGGLRYLQHFNLKRMHRSIRSRRFFMQLAPHLIDIVPFKLPLKGWGIKSPLAMRIALLLNDLISFSRNRDLAKDIRIPNGRVTSPQADTLGWFSTFKGLNGIGIWSEAVVQHTERMVLEVVKLAHQRGTQIANYCAGEQLQFKNNALSGLFIKDMMNGEKGLIQTPWVIDCGGHLAGQFQDKPPTNHVQHWARAVNAVIKGRIVGDAAIALSVSDQLKDSRNRAQKDERMLFFVPRQQHTLIGTFYHPGQALDDGLMLSHEEKAQFLDTINRCHPKLKLSLDDILYWHSGWLPTTEHDKQLELKSKSSLKLHPYDHNTGVIGVQGVKFTTAPEVARDVLQLLSSHALRPSNLQDEASKDQTDPPQEIEQALYARYGRESAVVAEFLNKDINYKKRIHPDLLAGEIMYACEHEMAQNLSDIMLRRFSFELDRSALSELTQAVSHIMQGQLGWSDKQRLQALDDTQKLIDKRWQSNA